MNDIDIVLLLKEAEVVYSNYLRTVWGGVFAFVLWKCEFRIVETFDIAQDLRLDNRRALVTIDREEIREGGWSLELNE